MTTWEKIENRFETQIAGFTIFYWPRKKYADITIPDEKTFLRLAVPRITYGGQEIREDLEMIMVAWIKENSFGGIDEGDSWETGIYLNCAVAADENDQEWFHAIENFIHGISIKKVKEWMRKDGW